MVDFPYFCNWVLLAPNAPKFSMRATRSSTEPMLQETPSGRKKIIPVGSDFDSSPSPEPPRGSANTSADTSATSAAPSPFKKSPTKSLLGKDQSFDAEDDVDKKRKSIGLKLKTSYSKCDDDKTRLSLLLSHD